MNKGIVTFYNSAKDYGFITDLETSKEYYIHSSILDQLVKANDLVSFELKGKYNRFIAVNVKPELLDVRMLNY
jgi:cold shock protein